MASLKPTILCLLLFLHAQAQTATTPIPTLVTPRDVHCGSTTTLNELSGEIRVVSQTGDVGKVCTAELNLLETDSYAQIVVEKYGYSLSSHVTLNYNSIGGSARSRIISKEPQMEETHKLEASSFQLSWTPLRDPETFRFNYAEFPKRLIVLNDSREEGVSELSSLVAEGYGPNTELRLFLQGEGQRTNSHLIIKILRLKLDQASSDFILIGTGNESSALRGSNGLMLRRSLREEETMTLDVSGRDAFIFFACTFSSRTDANFKIDFIRRGETVVTGVPEVEPPVVFEPEGAALEELLLCFHNELDQAMTCDRFLEDKRLSLFRITMADFAEKYAYEERITLPTSGGIRPEQVKVECFFHEKGSNRAKGSSYLTMVIVNPLDEQKVVFTRGQVKGMLHKFKSPIRRALMNEYEVGECLPHPDYWIWYWGGIGLFVFCVLLLSCAWLLVYRDTQLRRERDRRGSCEDPRYVLPDKATVNPAFEHEEEDPGSDPELNQGDLEPGPSGQDFEPEFKMQNPILQRLRTDSESIGNPWKEQRLLPSSPLTKSFSYSPPEVPVKVLLNESETDPEIRIEPSTKNVIPIRQGSSSSESDSIETEL